MPVSKSETPLPASAEYRDFLRATEQAHLVPLWERFKTGAAPEPVAEPPFLWAWESILPLIDRAASVVTMAQAERRVLSFRNPDPRFTEVCATTNINVGLQILLPGETAPAHRHNANALRFVVEGGGAETIVNGKPCPMNQGDLILNPGNEWHAHRHNGKDRCIWVDALDIPLVRQLDAAFFEPGPPPNYPEQFADAAFATGGFLPVGDIATKPFSPMYRYPLDDARRALASMPVRGDGSRLLRYVNPATGGPILSLLDCYLIELAAGRKTQPGRSTSNAVCVVAEGEGTSEIGGHKLAWRRRDIFTVPHWSWTSHTACGNRALLFMITDREVLGRLGLLRDEIAA